METLIVQPKNKKQLDAVEAVLKALDVAFKKEEPLSYNTAFVTKIKRSQKAVENGHYIEVDPTKSIWESIL